MAQKASVSKRPRFAAAAVKRASEADAQFKSFEDLSRPSAPVGAATYTLDLDAQFELPRKKSAVAGVPPAVENVEQETAVAGAPVEHDEKLAGTGNGLLQDWSCKRTMTFTSTVPFSFYDAITMKDREATLLSASGLDCTLFTVTREVAPTTVDLLRTSFRLLSVPSPVTESAGNSWRASANALCTMLEHSLIPYFYAIGADVSALFFAPNTNSSITDVTAVTSTSSRGFRASLTSCGVNFEWLNGLKPAERVTVHRSDLRELARIPGVEVLEEEEIDRLEPDAPLILRGKAALALLGTGLLAYPELLSPRPFLGCTVSRLEAHHGSLLRGTQRFYALKISGWLLPYQASGLLQAVSYAHGHAFTMQCHTAEHPVFNTAPGVSLLGQRTVHEVSAKDGEFKWVAL